jgi:hypothetical protein
MTVSVLGAAVADVAAVVNDCTLQLL